MTDWLTDNLESRDASASKKSLPSASGSGNLTIMRQQTRLCVRHKSRLLEHIYDSLYGLSETKRYMVGAYMDSSVKHYVNRIQGNKHISNCQYYNRYVIQQFFSSSLKKKKMKINFLKAFVILTQISVTRMLYTRSRLC